MSKLQKSDTKKHIYWNVKLSDVDPDPLSFGSVDTDSKSGSGSRGYKMKGKV